MNHVIIANQMISLITSSTTDPRKTNLTIKQVYLVVFLSLSHFLIKY